jgi:hypothetical protein
MPRIKLTKMRHRRAAVSPVKCRLLGRRSPGFGVKVTPKGRKVFIVLYRTGGATSNLRKYTIGPYGRVTLHRGSICGRGFF